MEIITDVEGVIQKPNDISEEMLDYLKQILAKLNEPAQPASAKLKAGISALPPFVSLGYEVELDTETTLRRYLPTLSKVVKRVTGQIKK
ncbi:MAG: hypothetical protein AB4058_07150 [Microcystaceae cyanobacterium]